MLRLNSTKISLNARDLDWHSERHEDRQARRAKGLPVEVILPSARSSRSLERHYPALPYSFPRPPSVKQNSVGNNVATSIISESPVPPGSRLFWDSVLVDSGVLPRIQSHDPPKRPHVVEPSDSFLENHHSLKAYIEPYSSQPSEHDSTERTFDDSENQESDDEAELSSTDYVRSSTDGKFEEKSNRRGSSEETAHHVPPKRRLSFFAFHRKAQETTPDEHVSAVQRRFSAQIDLDGCSDPTLGDSRPETQYLDAHTEHDVGCNDTGRHFVRQDSYLDLDHETSIGVDESTLLLSPSSEPVDQSTPPQLPLPLPRSVELFQRRSSGLPRSPLYISQAAMSSSPEKRRRSPTNLDAAASPEFSGFLAHPPRRRKTYKPRSESYSFVESEASFASSSAENLNPSTEHLRGDSLLDDPTSTLLDYPASSPPDSYNHLPSSPPDPMGSHAPIPVESSPSLQTAKIPSSSTTARIHCSSSLSPAPAPRPRRLFPSISNPFLPPLPPPFSATPRTVSFNFALPSSSQQNSTPTSPSPFSRTSTPPLPSSPLNPLPPIRTPTRTPSRTLPVYNDNLSALTQPQTPIGLPRNGLPLMEYLSARPNPAHTAPAGLGGRNTRSRATTETGERGVGAEPWQGFPEPPTPTRRGRTRGWRRRGNVEIQDQENLGFEVEVERWGDRMRRGVDGEGERGRQGGMDKYSPCVSLSRIFKRVCALSCKS